MKPPIRIIAGTSDAGERLDRFLAARTSLSRRRARQMIADGAIICNQKIVRVQSRIIGAGDVVDLATDDPEVVVHGEPTPPVSILHEDRWILIADKPACVLSQPAEGSNEIAFDEMVLMALAHRLGKRPHLRLFHRLDRLTSGAVLFACNPHAQGPLAKAWADKQVHRSYLAVIPRPEWQEMTVDAPIDRASAHQWKFAVDDEGKPARTHFVVEEALAEDRALLRCTLDTGRTHQVRVHLAHLGVPVIGDRLYGGLSHPAVKRPLLHAADIALPHPKTGKRVSVTAPLPDDFAAILT